MDIAVKQGDIMKKEAKKVDYMSNLEQFII